MIVRIGDRRPPWYDAIVSPLCAARRVLPPVIVMVTGWLATTTPAAAQSTAPEKTGAAAATPDSALTALKGRSVTIDTTSGLSAEGELASFDAQSVTVLTSQGRPLEVKRADILEIRVTVAPEVSPDPGAAPPPEIDSPPLAGASEEATTAPPGHEDGGGNHAPPPQVATTLTEFEQKVLQASDIEAPQCLDDAFAPGCREALAIGAKEMENSGTVRMIIGLSALGLGATLAGVGGWQVAEAKAEGDGGGGHMAAAFLLFLGSVGFTVTGAVLTPLGVVKANRARDYMAHEEISFQLWTGPSIGGAGLTGKF